MDRKRDLESPKRPKLSQSMCSWPNYWYKILRMQLDLQLDQ